MSRSAEKIVYGLPQVEHLSDSRIARFVKRLEELDLDVSWHCKRLAGFGGSESGSILRHSYGVFFDAPGDSFKNASEIVSEKLMAQLPNRATIQARRGIEIEPLTQAVFRKKYNVEENPEGFRATQSHASISCMLGNIDDSVFAPNRSSVLIDYKSSQHIYEEKPFDYVVQQHHYEAIARSNGFSFSKGLIVGLHAPEQVLQELAAVSKNRKENPEAFEFWVEAIATRGMPGVELKLYPITFDDNLIAVLEKTLPQIWSRHVLAGKLLSTELTTSLPEETTETLNRMMGETAHLMAMREALDRKIEAQNKTLDSMLLGVDHSKLSFTKKHNINISARKKFSNESGVSALEAEGVDIASIRTKGKNRDPEKVERAFVKLGGNLESEDLLKDDLPVKTIRAKLKEHNIDPSIYETTTFSFSGTRQKRKSELFNETVEYWSSNLQEMVDHERMHSPADAIQLETHSDPESMTT